MGELTQKLRDQRRPFGLRQVDAQEVDGNPGQGDADADQRVDGVAVEGDRHQENGAQTEEHRVQQGQLWRDNVDRFKTSFLFVHFTIKGPPFSLSQPSKLKEGILFIHSHHGEK